MPSSSRSPFKGKWLSPEVFLSGDPLSRIGKADIEFLKRRSGENPRKRVRICAHKNEREPHQDMFIVVERGVYIRPHKHLARAESLEVLEGAADAVFFNERGSVTDVIRLGDYRSKRRFYYRVARPVFHTLLPRSDQLVLHESTIGPFDRSKTVFAPWSPHERNGKAVKVFLETLSRSIRRFEIRQSPPRISQRYLRMVK